MDSEYDCQDTEVSCFGGYSHSSKPSPIYIGVGVFGAIMFIAAGVGVFWFYRNLRTKENPPPHCAEQDVIIYGANPSVSAKAGTNIGGAVSAIPVATTNTVNGAQSTGAELPPSYDAELPPPYDAEFID